MNSNIVSREIQNRIRPWLKQQGFEKFTSRNAWRINQKTFEVINFQSFNSNLANGIGCTTFSFAVNLGVFYRQVLELPWAHPLKNALPQEYECHARRILVKGIAQPKLQRSTVWYVESDGSNLLEVVLDALVSLQRTAPAWFSDFTNLDKAFTFFQNKPEAFNKDSGMLEMLGGNLHSLARAEVLAGLSVVLNRREEAIQYYKELSKKEFYSRSPDILSRVEERINILSHMKKFPPM